ncbi:hypothetical protein V2A60_007014 [Cordyceps javanica]|uniref:FACT complex subunit POB3 n=1 Tax=Cordyceps javanica TaxID=43265 RepID=A0A545US78_9HYPO|nr:FACT complex subunit pob3 [Cordyceps javanica]TQW04432.1 FACT complex subunit pob3 [Cordyceps javanica]
MRLSTILQASFFAACTQATLVSIKVPRAVRKGESFAAFVHVQSAMSSGEVAYIWGQLPNNLNSPDNEMGQILTVTDAKSLQLGENQVRMPGLYGFERGEITLKVRVITESFDSIYLDLSKESGRCRFAETGFGWKPNGGGDTFTLDHNNISSAQWSKVAKGYEIRILQRNSGIIQLDGFQQEDYDRLGKIFKNWYSTVLENKEHALRGWNWGKAEFSKAEIIFNVQNRPAFELPYAEIGNTNLAGRNEVAVEMSLPQDGNDTATANGKGKKAAAGRDQLVEMRFYVPGTTTKKEADGEDGEGSDQEQEAEKNAATLFYETLMDKAEIGEMAGDTIATFLDVLHLTPRGRFDIDMYEASFRLRGKTYDYKIQYDAIKKFMVLPKPDEMHCMLCIGLDPPLRQGQTRYPFVVMQFKKDEEVTIDLNLDEATLESKYKDKLDAHYEEPLHHVVAKIFRGLANKKISSPAKDFITHRSQYGIKCSIKASEGFLYCLEKAFMFVPKPATYIAYEQTQSITFSRVGGAVSTLSTFDITVAMKGGAGSSQFSNINREDLKALETFFKLKGLRVKNEIDEDANLLAAALREQDMDDSDDEVVKGAGADRGSADEDEESVDEDFHADTESDISDPEASDESEAGSGSDAGGGESDVDDEDMDDEEEEEEEERPKKKKKTS